VEGDPCRAAPELAQLDDLLAVVRGSGSCARTERLAGPAVQDFADPDAVTEDDVVQAVGILAMGLFESGK
jgi:hypothetical protein